MSSTYERELVKNVNSLKGFLAYRATGSQGECDVSVHQQGDPPESYIIEVKKSKRDRDNLKSWGQLDQFKHYKDLFNSGFNVFYAIRYLRGPWKFFDMEDQLERDKPHIFVRDEGMSFEEMFS